jgi:hypothetical protein
MRRGDEAGIAFANHLVEQRPTVEEYGDMLAQSGVKVMIEGTVL